MAAMSGEVQNGTKNKKIYIGFGAFLLGLIGVLAVSLTSVTSQTKTFGIIIDAGSSKSKAHVYSWGKKKDFVWVEEKDPNVVQEGKHTTEPGVAKLVGQPKKIEEQITQLITFAEAIIPKENHKDTVIKFRATAGMRLLSKSEQDSILDIVRKTLHKSRFQFEDGWASVISGNDEALFGWVAVNYLLNRLGKDSIGMMDLGGASTQIIFEPEDPSKVPSAFIREVVISSRHYKLFVWSFLGMGLDEARFSFNYSIASQSQGGVAIDGCLAKGYDGDDAKVLVSDEDVTLKGNSSDTNVIYNTSGPCHFEQCSMDGVYAPIPDSMDFFAISGYSYTASYLLPNQNQTTNTELKSALERYCGLTWEELVNIDPKTKHSFLSRYCFNGVHMTHLTKNYKFQESKKWSFATEINKISVEWSLGAMIFEAQLIPWIELSKKTYAATTTGIILASIFGLFVVIGVGCLLFLFSAKTKDSHLSGEESLEQSREYYRLDA